MQSPENNLMTVETHEEPVRAKPGFGFWVTTGLSTFIMIAYFLVSFAMAFFYDMYYLITNDVAHDSDYILEMVTSGFFLSLVTIVTSVVCIGLILIIVKVQKGITITGYLGLGKFSLKSVLASFGAAIVCLIVIGVINWFIGGTDSSEWMDTIYETSEFPPILWVSVIIFAPAFEELFFRGFIFAGYRNSRIGLIGTIFITSLGWAVLHVQYDVIGMLTIFLYGILFGIIRHKTGSVWITFFLHAFINLIATIGTAVTIG